MYEKKSRLLPGVSLVTDLYFYSSLISYGELGIRIPFYNMLQMARLEAQFDNPDYNSEIRFRNVSISTGKSKSPLLQEAIASYIIIMYRCLTDPGYLNLMAGYGCGCVSLARSNRPGYR